MADKSNITQLDKARKNKSRVPEAYMLSRTLVVMGLCGIVAFIVLGARLFKLQIIDHQMYKSEAIAQQIKSTTIASLRGSIYDTNMNVLGMSAEVFTVYISPVEIKKYEEDISFLASQLETLLGEDYGTKYWDVMDTYEQNPDSWYQVVARKVEPADAQKIYELKKEKNIQGIKMESDSKRYYPYGSLAAHVVGFVGQDNDGLYGLEYSYSDVLTGVSGRLVRARDALGTDVMYTDYEDYTPSQDGYSVVLTIDSTIQYYVEKHLSEAIEKYDIKDGGAAIVVNVNTGAVLGMASYGKYGTYDLNDYEALPAEVQEYVDSINDDATKEAITKQEQFEMWHNKAVSDYYEPGSTFKIITLAMALEEGVTNIDTSSYYCDGDIDVVGREPDNPVHCWKTAGHGAQTLTQSVQHSCNVAFVELGMAIGANRFYDYVEAFGLKEPTGIELDDETNSVWWPRENFTAAYDKSSLAAASFGQTFSISPLQLVSAVSATVNGGYLMRPYIVKETLDTEGNIVSKTEPECVRQVVSNETSKEVREILEKVVSDPVDGTGKKAAVAGYRIGGKTGTSTNTLIEAQTGAKQYIVSFIGIAPIDNPEIAVLVLLDNPGDGSGIYASGGNMGAPTVGNIMADVLPYLGYEPEYTAEQLTNLDKQVPNLQDMTLEEAERVLADAGLGYRTIGVGDKVTFQLPAANSTVAANSNVIVYLGAEPSGTTEKMPNLLGLSYEVARDRMAYDALFVNTDCNNISSLKNLVVISQSVEPDTEVEHGIVVKVSLSDSDTANNGRF